MCLSLADCLLPGLGSLAGLPAKPTLLGKLAASFGILRSHHRIILRQSPFLAIVFYGQIVGPSEIRLEHLELFAVLKTDDVMRFTDLLTGTAGSRGGTGPSSAWKSPSCTLLIKPGNSLVGMMLLDTYAITILETNSRGRSWLSVYDNMSPLRSRELRIVQSALAISFLSMPVYPNRPSAICNGIGGS